MHRGIYIDLFLRRTSTGQNMRTGGKFEALLPHPRQFEVRLVKLRQSEVSP